MATINVPQVPFTLEGNTTDQKAYVDMVNALLCGPLYNEYASIMQYATATAEQVAYLPNAGQALYNLTHRFVRLSLVKASIISGLITAGLDRLCGKNT
ncbi:hypothetical protein [Spiroplasma phoeniceum]|uniref:Uncharacterized protein n=1 Tax=Spiroplasma phoeniceum P40 TaxID=1276259 RepID=A0A345DQE3_9MOLU|nr:hypothetical protein [Spiroplasma phoeniceum]AXF96434.1 hypothetical protein SDAV_001467 [Spiroplasma phoeniceum P40]